MSSKLLDMAKYLPAMGLFGIVLLNAILFPWVSTSSLSSYPALQPAPLISIVGSRYAPSTIPDANTPASAPLARTSIVPSPLAPPMILAANSPAFGPRAPIGAPSTLADSPVEPKVDRSSPETVTSAAVEFNVLHYGAVGDGATDDVQAFKDAWTAACAVVAGYVHAPKGYSFLVYPIIFSGPCATNMTLKVDGTLFAPQDPSIWDSYGSYWLKFKTVSVTVQGSGIIDGQGQKWWADSCKTVPTNPCVDGPTAVVFDTCTTVTVKNIIIQNSQQMHLAFLKSSGILVNSVTISSPETSPNTDGIHLQNSSNVAIKNTVIGTGDDCISIQTGSFAVTIRNVQCGPGHGISVGGLGKSQSRAELSGLVVDSVVFNGATNGVRIKTWQGSTGYASDFSFKNIKMNNTKNPILIDQYYCDSGASGSCPNYTSNVVVSNIQYKNITGTSGTKKAVSFKCSETIACTGLSLYDVNLVQTSGNGAISSCVDAFGVASGTIIPPNCLST